MHAARIPSQDEVLQSFRRAGFSSLTPLQHRLIPLLLNRRDAIAEVPGGSGTSSAIAAVFALGLRGAGPALRTLVLLPTQDDVGKLARAFARFVRAVRDAPAFVALGETDDGRREQRRLERESTVVAGTTDRVIDHIRRGGLSFGELEQVIMREPDAAARADFVKDVQFISAKWAERPRVVLISRGPLAADDELTELLHHPMTMEAPEKGQGPSVGIRAAGIPAAGVPSASPSSIGRAGGGPAIVGPSSALPAGASTVSRSAFVIDRAPRAESLVRLVLGLRLPPLVALHSQKTDARAVADNLKTRGLRALVLPPGGGRQQADRRDALVAFSRRAVDVLLVPFTGTVAPDLEDLGPTQVVLLDLPTGSIRSPGGMLKRASVLALVERERDLGRLQEAIGVAFQRNSVPDDESLLTGAIDRILRRAKEDDRAELTRLRDRIRRQVPLLMRPFFMASLLKALLPSGATALREKAGFAADRAPGAERAGTAGEKPAPAGRGRGALAPAPAPHIPPKGQRGRFGRAVEGGPERAPSAGDSAQLFVSVGRNRRVFARDLTDLFTEKLQLAAGDIRDVRVFDKYSFVDIAPAKAQEAISKLSGIEVKGRPITVNYAKKKEEKGAK